MKQRRVGKWFSFGGILPGSAVPGSRGNPAERVEVLGVGGSPSSSHPEPGGFPLLWGQ